MVPAMISCMVFDDMPLRDNHTADVIWDEEFQHASDSQDILQQLSQGIENQMHCKEVKLMTLVMCPEDAHEVFDGMSHKISMLDEATNKEGDAAICLCECQVVTDPYQEKLEYSALSKIYAGVEREVSEKSKYKLLSLSNSDTLGMFDDMTQLDVVWDEMPANLDVHEDLTSALVTHHSLLQQLSRGSKDFDTLADGFLSNLEHCMVDTDQVCDEQPAVNVVWDAELLHELGSHEGLLQTLAGGGVFLHDVEQKLLNDTMIVWDDGLASAINRSMGSAHQEFEKMLGLDGVNVDQESDEKFNAANNNLQVEEYVDFGMVLPSTGCVVSHFSTEFINYYHRALYVIGVKPPGRPNDPIPGICDIHVALSVSNQRYPWSRSGFSPGKGELNKRLLSAYHDKQYDETTLCKFITLLLQINKWSGPLCDFEFELVKLHMSAQIDTVEAMFAYMDQMKHEFDARSCQVSECQFSETVVFGIRQETMDAYKILTEMLCHGNTEQAIFDADHIAGLASQEIENMLALFGDPLLFLEHSVVHADRLQGHPENMIEISAACQMVMVKMKWWHKHFSPWKSSVVWYCSENPSPWNINVFNPRDGMQQHFRIANLALVSLLESKRNKEFQDRLEQARAQMLLCQFVGAKDEVLDKMRSIFPWDPGGHSSSYLQYTQSYKSVSLRAS